MLPLVSVLVVTWNGRALLERCLPAVRAQTLADREVVVVDNGSTDGSVEAAPRLYPGALVVRSEVNLGFARGNNLGLPRCRGRFIALLNNDCIAEPQWLERAVAVAEAGSVGMVATRQLRAEDPSTIDSAGIALDRAAIAWDRGGGRAADDLLADTRVFGPSGGAALYRRELLDDVGLFAGALEMYYEDVDLAWRARLRGWDCAEAADARALHIGSASGGRNAPRKRFLLGRNKLWVAARCYPGEGLRRYLGTLIAYDLVALAGYLATARNEAVGPQARRAALAGRLAAVRGLGARLAERRSIQARRTAPAEEVLGAMAPIEPPWRLLGRFSHLPEGGPPLSRWGRSAKRA